MIRAHEFVIADATTGQSRAFVRTRGICRQQPTVVEARNHEFSSEQGITDNFARRQIDRIGDGLPRATQRVYRKILGERGRAERSRRALRQASRGGTLRSLAD